MLVEKIKKYYNNELKGKKFAVWGLAFKPETDDIREAPALHIIDELLKMGAQISAYDPEAMENVRQQFGDKISFEYDQYRAVENADALIIATEWPVFRTPDFEQLKSLLKSKVIFDGRNLYDLQRMIKEGFYYSSIGRRLVELV